MVDNADLPTIISSSSDDFFRMWVQISMANIVADELNIDVSDDISADIITASIIPRAPEITEICCFVLLPSRFKMIILEVSTCTTNGGSPLL